MATRSAMNTPLVIIGMADRLANDGVRKCTRRGLGVPSLLRYSAKLAARRFDRARTLRPPAA